jgi:hypothetical protein
MTLQGWRSSHLSGVSSCAAGGKSPGTEDGNGDGRGAIGLTAGPGADIGRGAGSFDFAARRVGLAFDLTFALRTGFRAAAFFRRTGAARFAARFLALAAFFAFRFFAMIASQSLL